MVAQKKVSVIIVSYNVQSFLELCLDSVSRALKNMDSEIIVVDNNSADDSNRMVADKFKDVLLIANKDNLGFSRANNQGLAIAKGKYIHFLNPDTVVPEDFYEKCISFMNRHPEAGGVGPRLIDGRGLYSADSKKSFPSFWTSVYKVVGLSRFFPHSKFFNRYYAAQVGEHETATVDILSGCCLLIRREAMETAGGGFDESYFMYCEDVDLCHRIGQQGYKNYYFPETTVIHYKGESTRKLSYRYMKIFYNAHALFVKKYYPPRLGAIYILSLRMVLALRNFANWGRHLFSLFKMYLLDAILLTLTTFSIKVFWFENIGRISTSEPGIVWRTIPFFVLIWLLSMFLNGAYDKPFSLFKAGRGMLLGTLLVLAGYGLLPPEYRYSRGVVLFSGMTGAIVLLFVRWLLSLLHWIKLVPRGKVDYKAVIVGDAEDFRETSALLNHTHYNLEIAGRVAATAPSAAQTLGQVKDLAPIQQTYRINEIIFNTSSLSYSAIMESMERCAPKPFYKIHLARTNVLIGSNNLRHHAEEFSLNKRYFIATAESKRNKRIIDLSCALVFLLLYPFCIWRVYNRRHFITNIYQVLIGRKTWIGYPEGVNDDSPLPRLKPGVLPPYPLLNDYIPGKHNAIRLSEQYAVNYSPLDDLRIIGVNFKFLGEKKI